jgi:hypothetical protein
MADIFISYSKSDHALALKLSTFLESEGWTVWWDKSLGAADLYRDEIMKQLAASRAVITIWTPNSIQSDWVRAEAGRAKADGKLIPVKTPDLTYGDIPLPFGEMHTENVTSTDLIRGAIVAQLAKPAVSQSPFRQITSTFKYQILTWIGIVGSAITVFGGLSNVLDLADFAKELVAHWHEWNQAIWGWVFGLIEIKVPREFVPFISFIWFTALLVLEANLSVAGRQSVKSQNSTKMTRKGRILRFSVLFYGAFGILFWFWLTTDEELLAAWSSVDFSGNLQVKAVSASIMGMSVPISFLLSYIEERAWVLVASLLFSISGLCLLFVPLLQFNSPLGYLMFVSFGSIFLQICLMAVIVFSPLQQLTRRLAFVVLGVLTLVLLSEISKLNLHQFLHRASDLRDHMMPGGESLPGIRFN